MHALPKKEGYPAKQIMAPLPELHTRTFLRAFSQISVDFGEPYIAKQGRGKTRQKRYLYLFTCLATRAVHLKIAFSLDTDSFLNASLRRHRDAASLKTLCVTRVLILLVEAMN